MFKFFYLVGSRLAVNLVSSKITVSVAIEYVE